VGWEAGHIAGVEGTWLSHNSVHKQQLVMGEEERWQNQRHNASHYSSSALTPVCTFANCARTPAGSAESGKPALYDYEARKFNSTHVLLQVVAPKNKAQAAQKQGEKSALTPRAVRRAHLLEDYTVTSTDLRSCSLV
jgi:hypothetical protein